MSSFIYSVLLGFGRVIAGHLPTILLNHDVKSGFYKRHGGEHYKMVYGQYDVQMLKSVHKMYQNYRILPNFLSNPKLCPIACL